MRHPGKQHNWQNENWREGVAERVGANRLPVLVAAHAGIVTGALENGVVPIRMAAAASGMGMYRRNVENASVSEGKKGGPAQCP